MKRRYTWNKNPSIKVMVRHNKNRNQCILSLMVANGTLRTMDAYGVDSLAVCVIVELSSQSTKYVISSSSHPSSVADEATTEEFWGVGIR